MMVLKITACLFLVCAAIVVVQTWLAERDE